MHDYTWPSVFFAYFFFGLMVAVAAWFLYKTARDGYWGEHGEDIKYQVFDASEGNEKESPMSEQKANPAGSNDVKEYAGGWMTERKGTDAPAFLKFAFPLIGFFCVAYLIVYMNGEVTHSDRGEIVRKFNEATQSSPMLMYTVAGMALIYVILVVLFTMGKPHKED